MLTSESDWAKYPFTVEAGRYVQERELKIDDLANQTYMQIFEKAVKRVEESILNGVIHPSWRRVEDNIEILSYPVANMIVMAIGDSFLKRRYSLAEAKRAQMLLVNEPPKKSKEHTLDIAINTFGWGIRYVDKRINERHFDFAVSFADYLRDATGFRDDKWKLVNRIVIGGYVYLTTEETIRLLQEEIRKKIEKKLEESFEFDMPPLIDQKVELLKNIVAKRKGEITIEEMPKEFIVAAFPPCIKSLYSATFSGQNIPHLGRFTLTSFLLNAGMTPEEVMKLFSQLADFDQKMTQYQVEHIAGVRGSRTKYSPPNCDTLRTHGICIDMDELCSRVRHPLTYYKRKMRVPQRTEVKKGREQR